MRLAAPMAATTVTGTEIASAHGEAATSTTRARSIQVAGSPSRLPITAMRAARIMIPGTRGLAIRSARRWASPLRDCSASTMCTIRARELSSAVVVTSTSSAPVPLIDPANTSSPGPASTGHRLAGDGGDVQRGAAGADDAVGGDPLTGLDQHQVADREVGRRDGDLGAVAQHGGLVRDQGQQRAQAAAGAGHRVLLQSLADGEQEGQHGGLADLAEDHRADRGDRHQRADADLALGQPLSVEGTKV